MDMKDKKVIKNKKVIIISLLVVALVIGIICILFVFGGTKKSITGVKSFTYSTSGIAFTSYAFTCDNTCYDGRGDEMKEEKVNKIIELLNKYKVKEWDGFDKDNGKGIFDAKSFTLDILLDDGTKIHAEGVQAFPKNYSKFEEEFNKIVSKSSK